MRKLATRQRRALLMLELMSDALDRDVEIRIITKPASDFKDKLAPDEVFSIIKTAGVKLVCKSNIHHKFELLAKRERFFQQVDSRSV